MRLCRAAEGYGVAWRFSPMISGPFVVHATCAALELSDYL